MHKVVEGDLVEIALPKLLFSHIDEIELPELDDAKTDPTENTKTMAPHCRSTPSHFRRTHPWNTHWLPQLRLRHAHASRLVMPPFKRKRETYQTSTSLALTTFQMAYTSIGCTKTQETTWMDE